MSYNKLDFPFVLQFEDEEEEIEYKAEKKEDN